MQALAAASLPTPAAWTERIFVLATAKIAAMYFIIPAEVSGCNCSSGDVGFQSINKTSV